MVRVYAKSPDTYFQDGGANMQPQQAQQQMPQIDQEQLMQIIQMFAQITGNDPQQVMQQLQQLPPEQQMQAVQQMAETIQSQQQAPEQAQMQQAPPGMPPGAAEEIPVGEDAAMDEMGGGEEMMAPPMMFGGMTGYAKTNKKLLKKAMGGTNTNVTYQTEQERIGQKVNSAIGNNFVNSLIDQATDRFGQRAPQMQTNFAPGGTFTNQMFDNPYLSSANDALSSARSDMRNSQYMFGERLDDLSERYNPYVEMTGRAKGKVDADGNRYGILNRRPKFVQRDYTPGASIENSGLYKYNEQRVNEQRDGGNINASMAFYKNGGYTTIPIMGMFQDAGEVEAADVSIRDAQGNERMVTEAEAEMWQNRKAQDPNASLDDLSFASQAPGYKGTFEPKTGGKANYDLEDEEEDKKQDSGYVDLNWRGNLDKATENLYLKDSDIRTGFLNRKNVRRAKFTFGERGTGTGAGTGAGALGATGAGQTSGNYTNSRGQLVGGNNSGSKFTDYTDEELARMGQRGQRQIERNADRYRRQTGEELDMSIEPMMQPNVQNTQSTDSPMGYSAQQAQYLMNNQIPSMTGNYSDQFQPNFGAPVSPTPMMTPEEAAAYVSQIQFRNGGYYLPQAIDGIDENMSEEDKFQITMKEKSGLTSALAPLGMAGARMFTDSINSSRALEQKNDAFNVALNTPSLAGDYVGGLGSFENTTGTGFMPNLNQGMLQGRLAFANPAQQYGSAFGRNSNRYRQDGGQPDLSQYDEGGDYWMTEDEVKQFMKMGGKVEYY